MSGRGMKKWNAYKTLQEQFEDLDKLYSDQKYLQKPTISDDEIEQINYILTSYYGQKLSIKYYRGGEIFEITSPIMKIDSYHRKLILPDGESIRFDELLHLESTDIFY